MQAIQAKYLPATNHRGDRVKVWCRAKSKTVQRGYGCDWEIQAYFLAHELARDLHWIDDTARMANGTLPNGDLVFLTVD